MSDTEASVNVISIEADHEPTSIPYRQTRCRHISPKGARCRLSQISALGFCRKHGSEALALESTESKRLARELMGSAKNFKTAVALNQFVGKALALFVERRITPREAEAISRLAHILLLSLDRLSDEYMAAGGWKAWEKMVQENIPSDAMPVGLNALYAKIDAECDDARQSRVALASPPREIRNPIPANSEINYPPPHFSDRSERER
jgi:hypothetical protein